MYKCGELVGGMESCLDTNANTSRPVCHVFQPAKEELLTAIPEEILHSLLDLPD